jgi:tRNA pseudouridine32 synthase / 23S rRNA pseudouridine746 synthase
MTANDPLPQRQLHASTVYLAAGPWTVLEALCARFPAISRERWIDRIARGSVRDGQGSPIALDTPCGQGLRVHYQREVPDELPIPFEETVLHVDEHLLIADKPHFLPVIPSGMFVEQTLLRRLIGRTGNADLVPLHRIDRLTAGLVMFSTNRDSRSAYQALFQHARIDKEYEALAPPLPELEFPHTRRSRLVRGEPFFRTQESTGDANSETRIELIERGEEFWRYRLRPITGKKHQLRVHMAALGAPIVGDTLYPQLTRASADDHAEPLRLLAQELRFADPLSGEARRFESTLKLRMPPPAARK